MRHAPVRFAVLTSIAIATGGRAAAQGPSPAPPAFGMTLGIGATVPAEYSMETIGVNARVGGIWSRNARLAFRGELHAHALSHGGAAADCIPNFCYGLDRHPDQVYSATLSAELRPFPWTRRVFSTAGAGVYHARGSESPGFGTEIGLLGGVGLNVSRSFVLEVQYQYLPNEFGTLGGMLTPGIAYRF
jgi:hypothetical protein